LLPEVFLGLLGAPFIRPVEVSNFVPDDDREHVVEERVAFQRVLKSSALFSDIHNAQPRGDERISV
jgi:hypothetical protein